MRSRRVEIDDGKYCTVENNNLCNNFKLQSFVRAHITRHQKVKLLTTLLRLTLGSCLTKINVEESKTYTHIHTQVDRIPFSP